MSPGSPLPTSTSVESFLETLLGRKTSADEVEGAGAPVRTKRFVPPHLRKMMDKSEPTVWVTASFAGSSGELVGACRIEIGLAAGVGAALTLLPPAVVERARKEGRVGTELQENLREVFNICSTLFTDDAPDASRVGLAGVFFPPEAAPPEVAALFEGGPKVAFKVRVRGYDEGELGFATA